MKSKHPNPLILGLVFVLALAACEADFLWCPEPSGGPVKREWPLQAPVMAVALYGQVNMVLYPADSSHLVLEGNEALFDGMRISQTGGYLQIDNPATCPMSAPGHREISVHLFTPYLHYLHLANNGQVFFADTLRQDTFILETRGATGWAYPLLHVRHAIFKLHTGVVDIIPHGKCTYLDLYAASPGRFNGLDFSAREAVIQQHSRNHAFVHVTDTLQASLLYDGNIYHRSQPWVEIREQAGQGSVFPYRGDGSN